MSRNLSFLSIALDSRAICDPVWDSRTATRTSSWRMYSSQSSSAGDVVANAMASIDVNSARSFGRTRPTNSMEDRRSSVQFALAARRTSPTVDSAESDGDGFSPSPDPSPFTSTSSKMREVGHSSSTKNDVGPQSDEGVEPFAGVESETPTISSLAHDAFLSPETSSSISPSSRSSMGCALAAGRR